MTARILIPMLSIAIVGHTFQARGQVNLVNNGGFEGGRAGWGWTYNVGIAMGYTSAAEGGNWADVMGTLYQDLQTIPGQHYHLRFAMAGNFNRPQAAELDVHWDGLTIGSLTWDPSGHSIDNLGWVWGDFDVAATDSTTRLTFENPFVGTQNIPDLDAVQIVVVPEPSSLLLLCLGAVAASGIWAPARRQRAACSGRRDHALSTCWT